MKSGLYQKLVDLGYLIPHDEVATDKKQSPEAYRIIKPKTVPFISYPYEWCFSQLKDAALLTLAIQKIALEHGMSLKDASAFNIQFLAGKPVLIDTLSFEKYKEGDPWVAYKQFCQHFLAPLALMTYTDIRLIRLFQLYIDGIPLDLASRLLPLKTKLKPSLLIHLHLHAASQRRYQDKVIKKEAMRGKMSKRSFLGLIDSLEGAVKSLKWEPKGTEWADYYENKLNYIPESLKQKAKIVEEFLNKERPKTVWDVGGNTGLFSRIAADKEIRTISFDIDPAAVEINYRLVKEKSEKNILPLIIDFTNPSPSIGWENTERDSLLKRGPVDAALALALIHHLAISNNLPLGELADFFSSICKSLIIEFVPKEDSQVQKLLSTREDIFPNYTKEKFEEEFRKLFRIKKTANIINSNRVLYLMIKK
ncbi:MAG: class I SAM-dependent methyltransferase [Candidatus Woykebacteria bacterium]